MLFFGEYRHTLDAKNRIFIPAKYRETLGESFYITRRMERALAIYPESEWRKLTEKINMIPDSAISAVKQFLFSKTFQVSPDSQGRIVLPPDLLKYAKIEKNAVIIGSGEYLEVWSEVLWSEKEENFDTAALTELLRQVGL